MSPHAWRRAIFRKFLHRFCRTYSQLLFLALTSLLLVSCAGMPATEAGTAAHDGNTATVLLEDFVRYQRLSARDASRERTALASTPPTPVTRLRLAMLWGLAGSPTDLLKASGLANGVLKSAPTEAPELNAFAKLLATHYQERIKAEAQGEKLAQQLKESLRRNDELQDKLNAVAEIEQSIPLRPALGSPAKSPQ